MPIIWNQIFYIVAGNKAFCQSLRVSEKGGSDSENMSGTFKKVQLMKAADASRVPLSGRLAVLGETCTFLSKLLSGCKINRDNIQNQFKKTIKNRDSVNSD